MFSETFILYAGLFLRILAAGFCGVVIGFERKSRLKEAGIRTHFVVAVAAALLMIVSKYGFSDVLRMDGMGLDPSRIAAQIVSGVGFLGAGIIFVQKRTVTGLTTAAGILATAGIGMAVGAGLYGLGIAVTAMIVIAQIILHKNIRLLQMPKLKHVTIHTAWEPDLQQKLTAQLKKSGMQMMDIRLQNNPAEGLMTLEMIVEQPPGREEQQLLNLLSAYQVTIQSTNTTQFGN